MPILRPSLTQLSFLGALGWTLVAAPAEACSPVSCVAGELVPGGGTVPVNLPAVEWLGWGGLDPVVSAVRIEGTTETPVEVVFDGAHLITFSAPLEVGATYRLRASLTDCFGAVEATFGVAAEAPLPSRLGVLEATALGRGTVPQITDLGSCSLDVDADRTSVTLTHDPIAAVWADALVYETWVDGVRFRPRGTLGGGYGPPSGSWIGRGADELYTLCGDTSDVTPEGLTPGTHAVEMRARVAGTETFVASSESSVSLGCAPPTPPSTPPSMASSCEAGPRRGSGALALMVLVAAAWARRRA